MPFKKILLLFFLFFTSVNAFADVFVVTSNADSGPGTLRDALTQAAANGTAVKDYINFNIADQSEAGRTITISSALPYITSNLVIDGTTQPGNNFGVSDAKVILQPISTTSPFNAFVLLDVDGFEIYGLYVRDFFGRFISGTIYTPASVLYIEASKNVQVGAPGKGNVFVNNGYIGSTYPVSLKSNNQPAWGVENLKVYSNFFGFEPDGKSLRGTANGLAGGFDISYCKGVIEFGGANTNQRNIFGNALMYITGFWTDRNRLFNSSFLIENNYFNYDINGNSVTIPSVNTSNIYAIFFDISRWIYYYETLSYPYSFQILNNKIQSPYGITLGKISGDFIFQGNQVKNENAFTQYVIGGIGCTSTNGSITIGGEGTGEPNSLYGTELDLLSRKSVLIQRNSIYCVNTNRGIWYPAVPYLDPPLALPIVNITGINATSVNGTATPLSKVELFWDDDCSQCQPLTYITTVNADVNGNWQYSGAVQKGVIASATLNGFTSLFTQSASLNVNTYANYQVTHASCGQKGSILGLTFQNSGGYHWKNSNGDIIGTSQQISGLVPGKYTLTAENGTCSTDYTFQIYDATPQIIDANKHVTQPSCGLKNGSVTYLSLSANNNAVYQLDYTSYTYKWTDASGTVRSTGFDLTNVEAGTYHLEVTYKSGCKATYDITLTNTTGPNINPATVTITPSNCGQSTGSITGMTTTGTGAITYSWKNAQQQQVAITKDLLNQPAGSYTLQVNDQSSCGSITSAPIAIPEANGITIDTSAKAQTQAICGQNNGGSITNIKVAGATTYQWIDAGGNTVGSNVDLTNVAAGRYYLTASNAFCSKQTIVFTVTQQANTTNYLGLTKKLINASCGLNNGSIQVIFMNNPPVLPVKYRWVDSKGQTLSTTGATLSNIDAGTYAIYATDANGCEKYLISYSIGRDPALTVTTNNVQLTDDHCQTATGSIKGIGYTGKTPVNFTWTDASGAVVANTIDLAGIKAGTYNIKITDGSGCEQDLSYTINNTDTAVPLPSVSNVQLCTPGAALVAVNNPSSLYGFKLYDNATNTTPIAQNISGKFNVVISANRSYFISQYIGDCESSRAEIKIGLGLSKLSIANTFTPNNDGINDTWKITGMENYPEGTVQIYNRTGQLVFESKGYTFPFDGRTKGQDLPVGSYYYIINLNTKCDVISGSITLVR